MQAQRIFHISPLLISFSLCCLLYLANESSMHMTHRIIWQAFNQAKVPLIGRAAGISSETLGELQDEPTLGAYVQLH